MGIFDRKPARGNWLMDTLDLIRAQGYGGLFRGVFNIETGFASVSTSYFSPCDVCAAKHEYVFTCSECGRSENSSVRFLSGIGDGIYGVLSLCQVDALDQPIGALIIMNPSMIQDKLHMILEEEAPLQFDLDYRDYLVNDIPGLKLADINVRSSLIIGDFLHVKDGEMAYINIKLPEGSYSVYLYAQSAFALIVRKDLEYQFALYPDYLQVITDGNPHAEMRDFALGPEEGALIQGHLIPQGKRAISINTEVTDPARFEILQNQAEPNLDYLTWVMQFMHVGTTQERHELAEILQAYIFNDEEMSELERVASKTRGYLEGINGRS